MGVVRLITTTENFDIQVTANETLLEVFRKNNIPIQTTLLLDENNQFVSLISKLKANEVVYAYSLRNPNYAAILPNYQVKPSGNAVTELIRPLGRPEQLGIIQYSREEAFAKIYASVSAIINSYRKLRGLSDQDEIQVALSSGGDGRALAECLGHYQLENRYYGFRCVIMSLGFEDEYEHISNAIRIAEQYDLQYETYNSDEVAAELGYTKSLNSISKNYRHEFPNDEAEVIGTYWVQELNIRIAEENSRSGIIFGYNQEDVIADKFYQLLSGKLLPAYPIRELDTVDLISPLAQAPKKLIDALDLDNSIRNYAQRVPSVSYLRTSLYMLAYMLIEQFPAVADVFSGPALTAKNPEEVYQWLSLQ